VLLLGPLLAERARLPGLIGLIVAGLLLGPNGFGIVERSSLVAGLGQAGLLFLMFQGGLELDLPGFAKHRRDSVVFGAATLVIPTVITAVVAIQFDVRVAGALILASAFASHTLLSYPIVQRFGLTRDRAVTASLGATLIANVGALLFLAVVAANASGNGDLWFWTRFAVLSVLFLVGVTALLPRATKTFFAGVAQDRAIRVSYILAVLFGAAVLSDAIGIEPIVGAFMAGLGVNRFIPPETIVAERLNLLGSALFVPLFLVSTGMLIDPAAIVGDPRTVLLGLALTGAAIVSKAVAVVPAALALGFDRAQSGIMFSLTVGQAAGALAAAIVAEDLGLIGRIEVNAVILVILATALVAGVTANRFAPLVDVSVPPDRQLGQRVVVPVANPHTSGPLVKIAALVAARDSGTVVPLNVLNYEATHQQVETQRRVVRDAETVALRNGAEAHAVVRIDATPTSGVLHTLVEQGGTCLVLGWKGYASAQENLFGGVMDAIISQVDVPTLVCRPGDDDRLDRVVVSVGAHDLSAVGRRELELTLEVARRMARQADVPLVIVTEAEPDEVARSMAEARVEYQVVHDARRPAVALRQALREGDVVVAGVPPRGRLGRGPRRLLTAVGERTLVITIPH
jgi:Kef-type K+ transport system membrane component KefB